MSGHSVRGEPVGNGRRADRDPPAGLAGGIAFALVLVSLGLLESVGRLLGAPGLVAGVGLLLIASIVGAFVYRTIGITGPLRDDVTDPVTETTIDLCFGPFVWPSVSF